MIRHHHSVKFYEDDSFLFDSVAPFMRTGLLAKGTVIGIATPEHCDALEKDLVPGFLSSKGRLTFMNGREVLSRFMLDGAPSEPAFLSFFDDVLHEAAQRGPVSIFGEMVAILWSESKWEAALRLEELWNRLATRHSFSLLCAYPLSGFWADDQTDSFLDVCSAHNRIILTSSCQSYTDAHQRLSA